MTPNNDRLGASFRDPSGFLFTRDGVIYRQINKEYSENYTKLRDSGLYSKLIKTGLLVEHAEVDLTPNAPDLAYKVIQPQMINFISYPYEWSFSQLKDAALATLTIQKIALEFGMSLKDSSAYNIQFLNGKPILIDSLSFEIYPQGQPWVAYRQFCQHFLAPLALMAHSDVRLSQLMRVYIDGVPLDLASKLLPRKTKFNFGLLSHIHLHASAQQRYADKEIDKNKISRQVSKTALLGLIDTLERSVNKLSWLPKGTEWGEYYTDTNYSSQAVEHKTELVEQFIEQINPSSLWDLGANTGFFSRMASQREISTLAFDIDPSAVEQNYLALKASSESNLLPLVLDLTNPSSNLGWNNQERMSISERGPTDAVMALALIHHLAISNNVPLQMLAEFFSSLGRWLIIEFVPKSDSQVKRLLATREDIFPEYTSEGFEEIFGQFFSIHTSEAIKDSNRSLYLMERL